jgi:hypothetical protein
MSFLCLTEPVISTSNPCKAGLAQPRRHTRGGFLCPGMCPMLVGPRSAFLRWTLCFDVAGRSAAVVSFKCLLVASSVRPDQVIRCPSLTACNIADFVELNRALCK